MNVHIMELRHIAKILVEFFLFISSHFFISHIHQYISLLFVFHSESSSVHVARLANEVPRQSFLARLLELLSHNRDQI